MLSFSECLCSAFPLQTSLGLSSGYFAGCFTILPVALVASGITFSSLFYTCCISTGIAMKLPDSLAIGRVPETLPSSAEKKESRIVANIPHIINTCAFLKLNKLF